MPTTATRSPKKPTPPTRAYRFDARLNKAQKQLIQRAADIEGRTMTDFVLHSAELAAQRTIEQSSVLTLTAEQAEQFVDAILNPAEPGPALRAAARRYKRIMGR